MTLRIGFVWCFSLTNACNCAIILRKLDLKKEVRTDEKAFVAEAGDPDWIGCVFADDFFFSEPQL